MLLLYFVFFINCSSAQKQSNDPTTDSLRKYSYLLAVYKDSLLAGETGSKWHLQGITTGFFVKEKGELYLVSSYHVFTQTSVVPGASQGMVLDVMRLRIFNPTLGIGFLTIDLRKIKERGKTISLYTAPDVYAYKISDTNFLKMKINTLDDILKTDRDKKGANIQAIAFGFPNMPKDEKIDFNSYKDSLYKGALASKNSYSAIVEFNGIDSLNTILNPASFNGASGSPVFYVYSKKEGNRKVEWIEFAGVMSASNPTYNFCSIVKKKVAIKAINKQTKLLSQ